MNLLFIGDVVGRSGRQVIETRLPGLLETYNIDFVVVNGENAAGGFGITEKIFHALIDAGADVITTGNHVWDQREALVFADRQGRFIRPANYPAGTPGRGGHLFVARNGARVFVANLMGQLSMNPLLGDPFKLVPELLEQAPLGEVADAVIIDFHAELTSEKQCFGHYLDGQVSLVVGTHTHVPTADYKIMPGGTAYMTDAGMTGDYHSSIGMEYEEPLNRFVRKVPSNRFEPAGGEGTLCGVAVQTSDATGLATAIEPLRLGPHLQEHVPSFWN